MNAPLSHFRIITLHLPAVDGQPNDFELVETRDMTVLRALKEIHGVLPPVLQRAFVCHAGACSTCAILIDGHPGVACGTFTRDLGADISIAPAPQEQSWGGLRNPVRCRKH